MYLNAVKLTFTAGEDAESVSPMFYLDKIIQQHEDDFEFVDPSAEIKDKIEEYIEEREAEVKNKLSSFGPVLREQTWGVLSPDRSVEMYSDLYLSSSDVMIYEGDVSDENIVSYISTYQKGGTSMNYMRLVSTTKDDCNQFIEFLKSQVDDVDTLVNEFVTLGSISHGSELVKEDLTENSEINGWEVTEPENSFEEEVQNRVQELVGPCLANVRVKFESGNNEYDVIAMPAGHQGNKFAIEVKDFEKVQEQITEEERESELSADNLQSKLINQPKISAERANLQLIMVVKDIPEESYENLLHQANPLGVTLLNRENYVDGLEEQLVNESIKTINR